jgi:hypothetical protein
MDIMKTRSQKRRHGNKNKQDFQPSSARLSANNSEDSSDN